MPLEDDHPARDPRALRCGARQARSKGGSGPFADGPPVDPTGDVAPGDAAQALYSVRSVRQPMEPVDFDLLFRRFAGLGLGLRLDNAVRHPTTVPHDRVRPMEGDVAREFRAALVALPEAKALMSAEHSSRRRYADRGVAPMKSFGRKGRRHAVSGRNAGAVLRGTDRGGVRPDRGAGRPRQGRGRGLAEVDIAFTTMAAATPSDASPDRHGTAGPGRRATAPLASPALLRRWRYAARPRTARLQQPASVKRGSPLR